jgi:alpha-D-xyloside xylohydrolase
MVKNIFIVIALLVCTSFHASSQIIKKRDNSVTIKTKEGLLKLTAINTKTIKVQFTGIQEFADQQSLVVLPLVTKIKTIINETNNEIILETDSLKVVYNKSGDNLAFIKEKKEILLEKNRYFNEISINNEKVAQISQTWFLKKDESIYGLGQHQEGIMDWRYHSVSLGQANTRTSVPFILSTKRYGILWDNYSLSRFDDNTNGMTIWSEAAKEINYYFIAGNSMDDVIRGYREITGKAPMYGKWAYGFWQSKERYRSQQEIVSVAKKYRELQVPIDNIVQDWYYWGKHGFNAMEFDKETFPDPDKMIKDIQGMNYHFMISVWPIVGFDTEIQKELSSAGYTYPYTKHWGKGYIYDAFNPKARDIYWKQMKSKLYSKGVDAWWLDATEPEFALTYVPEENASEIKKGGGNTAIGPLFTVYNAFPLMTTTGIYENLRKETDKKRVYILTRSAFAGQQRNAATSWSGDISSTWEVFHNQISAGLNFCMAGIPYWATDIGGFFTNWNGANWLQGNRGDDYRELYVRWFQYGAFCPIFRSHGTGVPREIWQFGQKGDWAYDAILKYHHLRYRLMPYIYSNAWKITSEGYTIYRGLPLDFPDDKNARKIKDQFMFGEAFLVNPVVNYLYHKPEEIPSPISPELLFNAEGKQGCLTGEYYSGLNFDLFKYKKNDSIIEFRFGDGGPDRLPVDSFSIRWTGKFKATSSGLYKFKTWSDDGVRLWVNDQLIIDKWIPRNATLYSGTIELEAGKMYNIKFEYFEHSYGATVILACDIPDKKYNKEAEIPKTRNVYLPTGTTWTDFWTGKTYEGGQTIAADAPIDIMPLYVRAGSIVPFGPFLEYSTEKMPDPIELRIYPGKNGQFTLYEDENNNYNYEKGIHSTIHFNWDDLNKTLTIEKRKGEYPEMLKQWTFNIVLVKENTGTGLEQASFVKKILYRGDRIIEHF